MCVHIAYKYPLNKQTIYVISMKEIKDMSENTNKMLLCHKHPRVSNLPSNQTA